MAEANRLGEIARVEKIVERPEQVVLTLSVDEAQMLTDVLNHVGGHDKDSRRALADTVRESLEGANFTAIRWDSVDKDIRGNVYFDTP